MKNKTFLKKLNKLSIDDYSSNNSKEEKSENKDSDSSEESSSESLNENIIKSKNKHLYDPIINCTLPQLKIYNRVLNKIFKNKKDSTVKLILSKDRDFEEIYAQYKENYTKQNSMGRSNYFIDADGKRKSRRQFIKNKQINFMKSNFSEVELNSEIQSNLLNGVKLKTVIKPKTNRINTSYKLLRSQRNSNLNANSELKQVKSKIKKKKKVRLSKENKKLGLDLYNNRSKYKFKRLNKSCLDKKFALKCKHNCCHVVNKLNFDYDKILKSTRERRKYRINHIKKNKRSDFSDNAFVNSIREFLYKSMDINYKNRLKDKLSSFKDHEVDDFKSNLVESVLSRLDLSKVLGDFYSNDYEKIEENSLDKIRSYLTQGVSLIDVVSKIEVLFDMTTPELLFLYMIIIEDLYELNDKKNYELKLQAKENYEQMDIEKEPVDDDITKEIEEESKCNENNGENEEKLDKLDDSSSEDEKRNNDDSSLFSRDKKKLITNQYLDLSISATSDDNDNESEH